MRTLVLIIGLLLATTASAAKDHTVRGHVTKKGTYVAPSHATNPNHSYSNGEGVPKNPAEAVNWHEPLM